MKLTIKENNQDGYLYITKHGLGPGTLPKGITVLREEELDNYLTVFWTDRFLTTKELNEYDIYPETMNNTILNRYGMTYNSFGENKERCNNKLTIKETNNDSNYKEQSIELLKQVEWIDVDMNLKDSEPNIRSFCMNLYNTLFENLTIVYYNKWYALKLQENVRLFFSFNKSSTYTIQFLNGKQVSVTKTRSNVNKVWYTEFDKYKFINLYLEDDN